MGESCTTCSNGTHYTQIQFALPTMHRPTVSHAASAAHRVDGLADRRRGGGWPVRECALAGTSRTARETTPNNRQHTGARDRRGTAFPDLGKIILAAHVGVSGVEAFPLKLKRSRAQHCRRRKFASGRMRTTHASGLNLRARLRMCSHARRIGKNPQSPSCNKRPGARRPRVEAGSPCRSGAGGIGGGLRGQFHPAIRWPRREAPSRA